jgi:LuxR family maltose regulon positive regulatory protein
VRLLDEQPDEVAGLHRRAAEWFEQNGERSEAIRHALAAGDLARAADLVELALPATQQHRQEAMRRRWLEKLPDELIRMRPVLSNAYAGSILVRGETEGVEARLRDAERWLDTTPGASRGADAQSSGMIVVDQAAFRDLPGAIAVHRAGLARLLGDVAGTVAHARRALDLVREDDHIGRGAAAALLGLAYWSMADLDAAYRWYADGMASLEKAGHLSDVIGCAYALADIRIAQGRLTDAMRIYERGLEVSAAQGAWPLRGVADMHVGMSELLWERNDLEAASQHLQIGRDLGEEKGLPQNPYRLRVAAARIRQARGDLDGAIELLGEAERLFVADFFPNVRPVAALKARAWIAQGKLPDAWGWAREHGLAASDDLTYVREFEHITLARLLAAQGARDRTDQVVGAATELMGRLLAAAEDGGRTGSVIDILVGKALAHQAVGESTAALASLARAIELAEPEGYIRPFVDEGSPMAALLKLAAKQPNAPGHVRRLIAASVSAEGQTPVDQPLIEPLSERELEVLRLLESDLDGPDIASELVVSLNTVRTHTKNIYAKLGVNSRSAAVRRAAELGLLSRTRDHRPAR